MSNSHHIKGSQDIHKPHLKHEKSKEMETHTSNSKKPQIISMIPLIGGEGKNMGHTNATENMENILFNNKGGNFNDQSNIIIDNNIPRLMFKPFEDCKKCTGIGYNDKNGKIKICKVCAEKAGKCLKCGGSGMKIGGKNCKRCTKL